jgi:DNA-binding NtrC family response regulator
MNLDKIVKILENDLSRKTYRSKRQKVEREENKRKVLVSEAEAMNGVLKAMRKVKAKK